MNTVETLCIPSNAEKVAMSTIFPGMVPYLKYPRIWSGIHNRFIVYIADQLQPLIRPRYLAAVEERVFVQGPEQRDIIPDARLKRHRTEANPAASAALLDVDTPVVMQVPALEIYESHVEILDRESQQRSAEDQAGADELIRTAQQAEG